MSATGHCYQCYMAHLTLKHDNLTALGAEAFAILTGLAPLDLPGRSTATGPVGVFDNPASRQVLTRRANERATLDEGVLNGLTALRRLHLCGGALAICLVFGGWRCWLRGGRS